LAIAGAIGLVGLLVIPVASALVNRPTPTGTFLSPLPEKQLAEQEQAPEQKLSATQAILSAQAYLEKAISLSRQSEDNQESRDQIIGYLNQSLNLANQAIVLAPQSPQAYLMRARVLASSSNLRPDATMLAQKDLEAAQALANGQPVSLPTEVNLLELIPAQQAAAETGLVIAAPNDDATKESSAQAESNTLKSSGIIAPGKSEVLIRNQALEGGSYVYLIPESDSVIYLKSKTEGQMVVATSATSLEEIRFEYWIVNP
jgi:hypothetical protein